MNAVKPLLVEMADLLESDLMEAMNRLETLGEQLKILQFGKSLNSLKKMWKGLIRMGQWILCKQ